MTTSQDRLDGSQADVQRSFARVSDWQDASSNAGEWLGQFAAQKFPHLVIYALISDGSVRPDSKIARHRKISGLPEFRQSPMTKSELCGEGVFETEHGLLFWLLLKPSADALPTLIDRLRSDRTSFLFLAPPDFAPASLVDDTLSRRAIGKRVSIDEASTIHRLISASVVPIRIWGNFDDPDLWVEIYTDVMPE